MRVQDDHEHPHGMSHREFDALFTTDRPTLFGSHGTCISPTGSPIGARHHGNLHVHGYVEEGTTTTPFDMRVLSRMDHVNLAIAVLDAVARLRDVPAHAGEAIKDKLIKHRQHILTHGEDLHEIRDWQWSLTPAPQLRGPQRAPQRAPGLAKASR